MTKFIIFVALVTLTGCKLSSCPENPWHKDLTYGTEVVAIDGFFKGNEGVIKAQSWRNNPDGCNIAAYTVGIYNKNIGYWNDVILAETEIARKSNLVNE